MDVSFAHLPNILQFNAPLDSPRQHNGSTTTHGRFFRPFPNILNTPLDLSRQHHDPWTFLSPISQTFSNSTPHLTHRGSTTAAQRPMDVSFAPLKHSLTPHLTYHGNTTTHGRSFRSSPNILNTPLDFPRQRNDPQTFLSPLSKHSPTQHPT